MAQATYDFSGRTALITGGGGDIGLAGARRLAARGAALALVDLDEAKLEAAAEHPEGRAATFECLGRDLTTSAGPRPSPPVAVATSAWRSPAGSPRVALPWRSLTLMKRNSRQRRKHWKAAQRPSYVT